MNLLAGYPLAIQVVLGNLGRQSVAEILKGLATADVIIDREGGRTESIIQCVEYSHRNLSAQAQRALLCLAPFSGFIDRNDLKNYLNQLQAVGSEVPLNKGDARRAGGSPFAELTLESLETAVTEAIRWGLLTPIDAVNPHLLTIQPLFPYFLKTKLAGEDEPFREALQLGFKNHYEELASYYQQLMQSKEPRERQLGIMFCRLEYENLYQALQIAPDRQDNSQIWQCIGLYFELGNNPVEDLAFYETLYAKFAQVNLQTAPQDFAQQIIRLFFQRANAYFKNKEYKSAKLAYQVVLDLLEGLTDKEFKSAVEARTYHQLGMVAEDTRQYEEARTYYLQALQLKIEFNDRYSQARTYHELGMVAEETRQYEEAHTYCQQALQLYIEFNDRYEQARIYHQLGRVAEETRQYEEARTYYQHALQIKIEFNDRYEQASIYQQLGMVAQKTRQYEEARTYYQHALQLFIEFNDCYRQAGNYHNLGNVAQKTGQYEEARTYYQQALRLFIEFNDRYKQASTYFCLGSLAEAESNFHEARANFQQALERYIEYQDDYWAEETKRRLAKLNGGS
jgi:tetratricopeptide (TPR) repeat protein